MTIWDTIFKAVFVVAVPITLAVYACVYVGERPNMTLPVRVRRAAARRGADAREDLFLGIWENGRRDLNIPVPFSLYNTII